MGDRLRGDLPEHERSQAARTGSTPAAVRAVPLRVLYIGARLFRRLTKTCPEKACRFLSSMRFLQSLFCLHQTGTGRPSTRGARQNAEGERQTVDGGSTSGSSQRQADRAKQQQVPRSIHARLAIFSSQSLNPSLCLDDALGNDPLLQLRALLQEISQLC